MKTSTNSRLILGVLGGLCERYEWNRNVLIALRCGLIALAILLFIAGGMGMASFFWIFLLFVVPYLGLWAYMSRSQEPEIHHTNEQPVFLKVSAVIPLVLIFLMGLPFVPWMMGDGQTRSLWEFFDFLENVTDFGAARPFYYMAIVPAALMAATPFLLSRGEFASRPLRVVFLCLNVLGLIFLFIGLFGIFVGMSPPGYAEAFWSRMSIGVVFALLSVPASLAYAVSLFIYVRN